MDLLSSFSSGSVASVSSRRIGDFTFDLVTSESHASKLSVTKNPIETGASISDHAFLEPKEVTINGIMVSYQPPAGLSDIFPDFTVGGFQIPLPVNIQAVTAQAMAVAKQVVSLASRIFNDAERVIAPYLPNFSGAGDDVSQTSGRIRQAYVALLNIQKSGELTEVMTGIELYKNMAITSIGLVQTNVNAAEFTITLQEVFIVETRTASGLKPTGRAASQSATKVNKGKTKPDQSAVTKIFNLF